MQKELQPTVEDDELLEGFLRIADERMADAIRRVSVQRGYDPAQYGLVVFGGAGGQHACAVADRLGIDTIVVPHRASLLSAEGLGRARRERFGERQVLLPLEAAADSIESWFATLAEELRSQFDETVEVLLRRRIVQLRFAGQDDTLDVDYEDSMDLRGAFQRRYGETFGYLPRRDVEVVAIRAIVSDEPPTWPMAFAPSPPSTPTTARVFLNGAWGDVPLLDRSSLPPDEELRGPALLLEDHSVVVVPSHWSASLARTGALRLTRTGEPPMRSKTAQPVATELYRHRFETIAREMGAMLQRTAVSTNVKERMDFSCTLLDPQGRLVVNAPHIPVHLGAMGECVRSVVDRIDLAAGDVVVTNHPAFGGSHLPDVTLLGPVDVDGVRVGYVAARAHHAEIGGITPGSMPPHASSLAEEGVAIPPTHVVRNGQAQWSGVESLLTDAPYPTRSVEDNLADLRAMLAAIQRGRHGLAQLAADDASAVSDAMDTLRDNATERMRKALRRIPLTDDLAESQLDDGARLRVRTSEHEGRPRLDFRGTDSIHPGNLNCTSAVVRSAVMYALRLLVDEDIPLNEGLLEAVDILADETLLSPRFDLDPTSCPAIVGGNVETSQQLVDLLLTSWGVVASGQGTMNNLSFGNSTFGYYETIGGGTGAGPGFAGEHGVHSHMTNTRITDVEILEHRYPVRVREFALRKDSGGAGLHRGGDGLIRELEFLDSVDVSILSERRVQGAPGLEGGATGKPGVQLVIRADGSRIHLKGRDHVKLHSGDALRIETPGGGGYGTEEAAS